MATSTANPRSLKLKSSSKVSFSETGPLPSCPRSEEHTSELQSPCNLVCRLLLEKKKQAHPVPQHAGAPLARDGWQLFDRVGKRRGGALCRVNVVRTPRILRPPRSGPDLTRMRLN